MSIHTSSSADEVLASAAESGPPDPLDALLGQIVGGYFVLTDGQGSVSKWSEPAELLFGRPAQEILGQSFFGTLLDPALGADAQSWRAFLENGDPPTAPGRVMVSGVHADGLHFPIEAVFVPVKLDEGFDFSLFLEDLGFELPLNLMLLRMRQQHPVVVRALGKAIESEPQPWEGWRTAGTLVVFRPLEPTPWVQAELEAREAARAEQDADVEDRLSNHDPGVQGSTVRDLDDAAAVVARLLSAMERIDDLERMAAALPAQVQEARRDVDSSRARAEAAEREAARLRADLERAVNEIKQGGNDQQHLELLARMERLERARLDEDAARASALKAAEASRAELAQRLERAEADRARAAEAIEGRVAAAVAEATRRAEEAIEEARTRADNARSAFESRIIELEKLRSGDAEAQQNDLVAQLERVRAEHEEAVQHARHELAATLEGIERDRERDAEAARAELRAALERVEHVQRESDALREQLTQMTVERHEAEGLAGEERRRLAELQRDAEETRGRVEALREAADGLRDEAKAEVAELRAQLAELQASSGAAEQVESLRATAEELRGAHHALVSRFEAELAELRSGTDVQELRAAQQELTARVDAELAELRAGSGSDLESLRVAAEALRAEQEAAAAEVAEQLAALQADAGTDVTEVRRAVEDLRAAQAALAGRIEQLSAGGEAVEELRRAQHELGRSQDELSERTLELLRAQDDFAQRHEDVVQGQAELSRRHDELAGAAAELRSAQEALGALQARVDADQAERERFHATTEHALSQLAEVRDALREHQSEISVQLPSNAVEYDEFAGRLAELRGEIAAVVEQAKAEVAGLGSRVEAAEGVAERVARVEQSAAESGHALERIAEASQAAQGRLDEIAGTTDGLATRVAGVEALADGLASREELDRVREGADAAQARTAARIDEVASEADAARRAAAEMVAAGQEIAARLDEAAQAEDELLARVDAIAGDAGSAREDARAARETADGVRGEAAAAREIADAVRVEADAAREVADAARAGVAAAGENASQALAAARDAAERVAELDHGTANVLADVRAVRDRVDETSTIARTAQETASAARADAEELHGAVGRLTGELQVARGELERAGEEALGARQAASTAQDAAHAAREDAGRAREEGAALRRELEVGTERLGNLTTSVERLGASAAGATAAAEAAQAEATAARRSGKELAQQLAELDSKAASLRSEMVAGRERLQALDRSVDQLGQASMLAGKDAEAAKAAVEAQGEELRSEIAEVRGIAERAQSGIDAILTEVALVRSETQRVLSDADRNRDTVQSGERRLEAMAAEVTFALKSLEEIKAGLTSAGQAAVIARREAEQAKKAAQTAGEGSKDNVTEVFAQLLGLAAKKGQSGVHRRPSNPGTKKGPSNREPRHGFDDAAQPMATLSLEGKFRELNPAFAKLVGYQEHEFGKATWPSPHDRSVYEQQQEQLSQLASGEIESVIVQSTYMHGQGLMVPVVGKLTVVPGEDGLPLHLLLEAEDRHTS
jgi:PAS domain S-box-containing protein